MNQKFVFDGEAYCSCRRNANDFETFFLFSAERANITESVLVSLEVLCSRLAI